MHSVGWLRVSGLSPDRCHAMMCQWMTETDIISGVSGSSEVPQVVPQLLYVRHLTGQVALLVHNVPVPGYWLVILACWGMACPRVSGALGHWALPRCMLAAVPWKWHVGLLSGVQPNRVQAMGHSFVTSDILPFWCWIRKIGHWCTSWLSLCWVGLGSQTRWGHVIPSGLGLISYSGKGLTLGYQVFVDTLA